MRNRVIEILAAVIGVIVVVALYLDRPWFGAPDAPAEPAPGITERPVEVMATTPSITPQVTSIQVDPVAGSSAIDPVVDTAAVAEAELVWAAARETLEAVQTDLDLLDVAFDAKEAEFEELEAAGTDSEELEDEMLIFLDGVVERYDELETQLAEAEAAELAAAEWLETLRGGSADAPEAQGRD